MVCKVFKMVSKGNTFAHHPMHIRSSINPKTKSQPTTSYLTIDSGLPGDFLGTSWKCLKLLLALPR
jgi:hypothetical protein